MRQALFFSVLLHILLLAIPSPDYLAGSEDYGKRGSLLRATVTALPMDKAAVRMQTTTARSLPILTSPGVGSTKQTTGDSRQLFRLTAGKQSPLSDPHVEKSTPSGDRGHGDNTSSFQTATADPEGIREYRLLLARAARQSKNSPALVTQFRWQGEVVLAISKPLGAGVPTVSIATGSGQAPIDEQAVVLMTQAVRAASLPDSLQGEKFFILLPVHYHIEE